MDAPNKPSEGARVSASAYPSGSHENSWATLYGVNPFDLVVRAGATYDVVFSLDGKNYEMDGLSLPEGATKNIQINASDFK